MMENVRGAPIPKIDGYKTYSKLFNNRWYGGTQRRVRRISSSLKLMPIPVTFMAQIENPTASTSLWIKGRQTGCKSHSDFIRFKEWQGLSSEFDLPPFRTEAKVKAVVNGVPLPMGRAMARAVKEAIGEAS
jgi:DNA (cytosine-5)-methyltransferase 1